MSDKESQADEVQALGSIFIEEEFSSTNENGVFHIQFYAFITVPEDFKIVFRNLNETENSMVNEQAIKVRYLPPIEMYFKLPHNYPSESRPLFQLCCSWLSYEMLEKLCSELDRLWKENKGSEILFIWTQFMKEECLNFLEIADRLDLSAMYTRELINVANSKLTQGSSISNVSEQKKDVEFLSNDNNNKVTAIDNCVIAKRLPLDGIVVDSNVTEKSHIDSVCSSENSGQEMMMSGDSNSFNSDCQTNTSSLVVNDVNSSLPATELPSCYNQLSSDKLSSSSSQLPVNNFITCVSAESVHTSDIVSKTLRRSGQRRVYDRRIRRPKQHKKHLHEMIEDYNRERSKTVFERNIFTCNICFANKLGSLCTQFKPCEHVFCCECISGYIEVRIKERTVQSINCPEHKCQSEASPPQMSDKESQANEVQALGSIFSEEEFSSTNENGVFHIQFYAFITVPEDFKIVFRNLNETENSTVNEQAIKVRYLPPIEMYFKLPHNYPSESRPLFQLCCSWLSYEMLENLCSELDRLWKENKGSEILFIWTQFMKEECLNFLEIADRLDLSAMYTRELINVANSKLTQGSSISNVSEQKKDVEFLSNDNNNKVTAIDNCVIAKRLPLDGIVVDSNVTEKSHIDSVCSSENSGQEMMMSGDSNSFNSDCQTNTSSLVVNDVNSSLPATELPSCCNQLSSDKLSSSSSQLPVNNFKTCVSAESVHTSDIVSKTLHRSGQRRVYDRRIRRPKQHKKHLHEMIQDYNRERSKTEFERNIFTCNICFANKLGILCTQFKPCEHVFCCECISGYIEVRIKEGTVQSINCPEHKCQSEASPPQIRELVSPDLFARYDHLLLSSILDTLDDIIYCPRSSCQYPVSKEENEKMAICPDCNYAFCIYCKKVYHGVEPCRLKNEEKLTLIKGYQSADRETKLKLEQRYGKSLLVSLVENHMSEIWIHNNSKNCPNCNTAIEKSDGCNKMVCWKCNAFFCWLCGMQLDPLTPYKHYNTKSRCNNRLFEGTVVEENDNDNEENFHEENEEEPEAVPFEVGYNMFIINQNLDPELENLLLLHIDNVD